MEKNMHIKGTVSISLHALSHTKKSTKIINLKCIFVISYSLLGEGNGTRLQYFGLENPMDGGAWWAADHGVARVGHN